MLLALVVAVGSGVLSFLAPCTIPLLPAYVGVLSGSSAGVPEAEQGRRLVTGSLLYVLGFAAVFVTLGALAGTLGSAVREAGGPVQRVGGVLVLLLAVALLLEARTGLLSRVSVAPVGVQARLARSRSWLAPLLLGVVFGTAFTPCVGPFLGAVLAFAAGQGGAGTGALLLGAYALGLGVPFVIAALAVAASPGLARRLSYASRRVALVGGAVLVVLGIALVTGEYGRVAGGLARFLPAASV
ncbi:MAG: cytochrome c biogenesis protein CcdA [Actinobacteria bacterium]|nr:cytochrome c biogenesis protein CcdA [Actinomycetota bacterium]MCA1719720.1 cytochrome c biogenesis protein CcdA [Actinomycetota bacterium]